MNVARNPVNIVSVVTNAFIGQNVGYVSGTSYGKIFHIVV